MRVLLRDPTRQCQGHADRAVGNVFGAVIRHVDKGNASLAGIAAVDIIDANAAADDHFALRLNFSIEARVIDKLWYTMSAAAVGR